MEADKPGMLVKRIEARILLVRGERVMLDAHLAELYGVATKRLNEQLRRNIGRFPADFMFQVSPEEALALRSQNATSVHRFPGGGSRAVLPGAAGLRARNVIIEGTPPEKFIYLWTSPLANRRTLIRSSYSSAATCLLPAAVLISVRFQLPPASRTPPATRCPLPSDPCTHSCLSSYVRGDPRTSIDTLVRPVYYCTA